jgi:hypothetical protein
MTHPPDLGYDFAREYEYYDTLRQHFGANHCLFVPCLGGGLSGYVTFNKDAQRLRSAVERLRVLEHEAWLFKGGAVLWVTAAIRHRAQDLQHLGGGKITFIHNEPPGTER